MPSATRAVEFDEKIIDAIFDELNQPRFPGAAVGIAIGGKPVYRKGFGLANMELPVVLSPSIRMRIGSTTKHFVAFVYMLLCEEGKAGIDDPIGKYLPELHPVAHKVTMRQLMGNTSGLRDAIDIVWQFSGIGRPISSAEMLSLYRTIDDVNAAPGIAWIYNNGGWLMLSTAIERITGQPLEDVLRDRVFRPVGMYDTLLRRFDIDFVSNSATLHTRNSAGEYEKSYLGTALAGEGGMVSTVDDMLRWLAHMDAPVVGTAATWRAMKEPQMLANGISTGYGLGLMSGPYRGMETLHHSGGVMGGNGQMIRVPAAGLDVVVLANCDTASGILLADKILEVCLPRLDPVKKGPSSAALVTGVYLSSASGRVIELFARDGQQIASLDGFELAFEPNDDGTLSPTELGRAMGFSRCSITLGGDLKKPISILYNEFGNLTEFVALKPATNTDVHGITGRYRSDGAETEAAICQTEDGPRLNLIGRFGSVEFCLECLSENIWRAKPALWFPPGGILLFDGNGFRFSSFRTWALPFLRITT